MTNIWYIHGANSTPRAFAYVKKCLPVHRHHDIVYTVDRRNSFSHIATTIADKIRAFRKPVYLVGHSLGGVLAAAAARLTPVKAIVTMSAPFKGSTTANLARWWYMAPLLQEMRTSNPIFEKLQADPPQVPVLPIVTTAGDNPFITEANDGVVTVDSQTAIPDWEYQFLTLNHSEVLLDDSVVEMIRKFIFEG